MKYLLIAIVMGLAGCQSAPAPSVLPTPTKPIAAIHPAPTAQVAAPAPATAGLEQKIRQQAQYIEALISQIDALTAKLAATNAATPPPPTVIPLPPDPVPPAVIPLTPDTAPQPYPDPASPTPPPEPSLTPPPEPPLPQQPEPTLTPNADNVIDLVAFFVAEKPGEPVNPFTVRTVPPEAMRQVSLQVGGIVAGPIACAIINDRLVQVGEIIESLAVERIEPDAVLLRHSGRLLRLPVAEKPTRVRLPL